MSQSTNDTDWDCETTIELAPSQLSEAIESIARLHPLRPPAPTGPHEVRALLWCSPTSPSYTIDEDGFCCCFFSCCVRHFMAPWTRARQASQNWVKFILVASVTLSDHLILCRPPSPLAFTLSQHQGLFLGVFSSHEMAKVLEPQLQDLSFQ